MSTYPKINAGWKPNLYLFSYLFINFFLTLDNVCASLFQYVTYYKNKNPEILSPIIMQ